MNQKRREPTLKKPPCGGRGSTPFIERLQRDPFEVIEERAAHKQCTAELNRLPGRHAQGEDLTRRQDYFHAPRLRRGRRKAVAG